MPWHVVVYIWRVKMRNYRIMRAKVFDFISLSISSSAARRTSIRIVGMELNRSMITESIHAPALTTSYEFFEWWK